MIDITFDGALPMDDQLVQVAERLELPPYYGGNLDALYDCLAELQQDVHFRLCNVIAMGRRGPALRILLQRASEENPHITWGE